MSNGDLKSRLERFIHEVWDLGDAAAVDRHLAPSYTIHHDPGDPWDGQVLDIEGFKARLLQSRAPFPDQRFDIQRLCEDGDAVAVTWLWRATHVGDIPGFKATGRPMRMSGATTYFFSSDHKLTGHWQISDRLAIWQQLHQNAFEG